MVAWTPATTGMASPRLALEELLHAGEEAGGVGRGVAVALALEALEQLAMAGGQDIGPPHPHLDLHVAPHPPAPHPPAPAPEAELLAGLGAFRDLDARLAAVDGRHVDVAAERGRGHGDRHAAEDVGAVALEELV